MLVPFWGRWQPTSSGSSIRKVGTAPERSVLKPHGASGCRVMTGVPWLTARQWLIVIHDLLATAAALGVTFFIRFEDQPLAERLEWLPLAMLGLVAFAAVVYFFAGLHEAKWRFTSLPELTR